MLNSCQAGTSGNSVGAKDGAITLKFNIPEGSKFSYSTSIDQTMSMMGHPIQSNIAMDFIYNITGAENNKKKLSATYDRIQMKTNAPGMGEINYDSKDENTKDPTDGALKDMIGKSFTITIAPNGDIVSMDGLSNITPSGASGLDENSMKQMMQTSFNFYPDKPVKPGDSWTKTSTMNMQIFTMSVDSKYTLKEIKGDLAIIDVNSNINMAPGNNPEMKDIKIELSGSQTGTMEVETASGQVLSSNIQQKITGKMNAQGQEMPVEMNSKISITGKKL